MDASPGGPRRSQKQPGRGDRRSSPRTLRGKGHGASSPRVALAARLPHQVRAQGRAGPTTHAAPTPTTATREKQTTPRTPLRTRSVPDAPLRSRPPRSSIGYLGKATPLMRPRGRGKRNGSSYCWRGQTGKDHVTSPRLRGVLRLPTGVGYRKCGGRYRKGRTERWARCVLASGWVCGEVGAAGPAGRRGCWVFGYLCPPPRSFFFQRVLSAAGPRGPARCSALPRAFVLGLFFRTLLSPAR